MGGYDGKVGEWRPLKMIRPIAGQGVENTYCNSGSNWDNAMVRSFGFGLLVLERDSTCQPFLVAVSAAMLPLRGQGAGNGVDEVVKNLAPDLRFLRQDCPTGLVP